MYTSSVLRQATELVGRECYLDALELIERRIDALSDPAIPPDPPMPRIAHEDLTTYLVRHQGEPFAEVLSGAWEFVTLCAAGAQLCMLTLGMGERAVSLIRRATDGADRFPEPFNEMLMSTDEYFSMMWYYNAVADKDVALRYAYRISSKYPGLAYEHECRTILETQDWDERRCRNVNFYTVFPDGETDIVVEHTLLSNPVGTQAYDAAVRDTVLASLERRGHTKENDWYWMQTLIMLVDDVHQLVEELPVDMLDGQARADLYDALLVAVAGHIAYQQADGFKSDYRNPAKLALSTFKEPELASSPSLERVRAALAGDTQASGLAQVQVDLDALDTSDDSYFVSTAFEDDRVFLSSSFRDMIAERNYLLTFTFPEVDRLLREFGVRLTPIDLRGIKLDGSEEGYDKECFKYCLSEIDRCDSLVGLVGSRYGWVMYDERSTDPAMAAIVKRVAREHGVPLSDMAGKSITHIEMMYGLRALERRRCYFYIRNLSYTDGATYSDLCDIGFADGHEHEADARQTMIMGAYGIQRIAPSNEPGANVQYYDATFDGYRISDVEGLGESIRTKLAHDHVFQRSSKQREEWYTRLLSFWSDMAHQTIPHPRLPELLSMRDRFIMLTGPEGIGKTTLLAQFWESKREHVIVVPLEALLEPRYDSIESMMNYPQEIETRIRMDLPRSKWLDKDVEVYIILDGLERVIGKHNRVTLLDNFRDRFSEHAHVILCSHEQNLAVPSYFKVMRLTEPPASPAELVRNTAFRIGKRLDADTIARLSNLGQAAGGNPLYIDLVTKRLLYLLQDEYEKDPIGWFDIAASQLDGTVRSAGAMMTQRAVLATELGDRDLARAVVEEVTESKQGSLPVASLVAILQAKGVLPAPPERRKEAAKYAEVQHRRVLRVISLLSPVILYDYDRRVVTLAHQSFIGTGKLASSQEKLVVLNGGAQEGEPDPQEMLTMSYFLGALVAALVAGSFLAWPYEPTAVVRTLVQVLALALLYGPVGLRREEWRKKANPTLGDYLEPPLYWVAAILAALIPIFILMREEIPQQLAGFAGGVCGVYPYLVVFMATLHCVIALVFSDGRGGKAVPAVVALATMAASMAGIVSTLAGWTLPGPLMAATLFLIALLYVLIGATERKEGE